MSENSGGGEIEIDWKIPEVWSAKGRSRNSCSGRSVCRLTAGWKAIYKVFLTYSERYWRKLSLRLIEKHANGTWKYVLWKYYLSVGKEEKSTNCVMLCTFWQLNNFYFFGWYSEVIRCSFKNPMKIFRDILYILGILFALFLRNCA